MIENFLEVEKPPAHAKEQLRPCHHPTNLRQQYHHSPQLIGLHQRLPQRPHHLPSGYALLPPMSTAHQPVRYLTLMIYPNVLRSPLRQQKPHMPRTTHGTLTLNFIGVGLTPSPCRHAYPRLPRTTPPLQEQHSQLPTIFPYLPLTELSLPCARSSPPTLRILRPYVENDINHNHAANLRKSKAAYTVNKSRPACRHYWPFPTTRLEFFCFSSDVHKSFFFFFIERGNFRTYWWREIGWLGEAPVTAGEWRLEWPDLRASSQTRLD